MNTLEILNEQRKAVEHKVASLQEDLGDIQAAIRAVEGRKGNRQGSQLPMADRPKPVLASGLRERAAVSNG